jgi:hypothetical protein
MFRIDSRERLERLAETLGIKAEGKSDLELIEEIEKVLPQPKRGREAWLEKQRRLKPENR